MSLEAMNRIRAVEEEMEQAKAEARAKAERIVAYAERNGRALLQQGQEASAEFAAAVTAHVDEKAAKRREEILIQTAQDCKTLRFEAAARMDKATQAILRRVVES